MRTRRADVEKNTDNIDGENIERKNNFLNRDDIN